MNQPGMNTSRWGDTFSTTTIEWKDLDKRKYYVFGPCTFILVVRYEGVRGLYKGFLPSTVTLVSSQFYITTYEVTRSLLEGYSSGVRSFCGGLAASLVGQTITVPIDIVSQHLMMQGQVGRDSHHQTKKVKLKGSLTITREILKSEGLAGLYRGYLVSLLTYAPSSAIWWWAYSAFLQAGAGQGVPKVFLIMGSGSMAALISSTSTNIVDLLRTRYQLESSQSLRECALRLWKEESWGVFHKGLSARIMQNAPTSAVMIIGYETVKRLSLKT